MKTIPGLIPRLMLVFTVAAIGLAATAVAQDIPAASTDAATATPLTAPQLDQLLGPIALYPDALVAILLPAATTPGDIVLADRYVTAAGTQAELDSQNWSDAVRSLAHYPEVLKWMDTNLEWTTQVGNAFVTQQDDVMASVQRLRAVARANGSLVTTAQQEVAVDADGTIEILPVQPDVIYVPRYDPEVVYVAGVSDDYYYGSPVVSFGLGFPVGLWLDYDFDWHNRRIWVGDHRNLWRDHHDWRQHPPVGRPSHPGWKQWHPPAHRPAPPHTDNRPPGQVMRPHPLPGAPARPPHPGNNHPHPQRPPGPAHTPPGGQGHSNAGPAVNAHVAPPQPRVAAPQPRVAPPQARVAAPEARVAPQQPRVAPPQSRVAPPQAHVAPQPRIAPPQQNMPPPQNRGGTPLPHVERPAPRMGPPEARQVRPVPGNPTRPLPPAGHVVAPPVRNVNVPPPPQHQEHQEERHEKEN